MITIRRARQDDAVAIGAVHVRAWQVGYRGVLPDALLSEISAQERAAQWQAVLADLDQRHVVFVAELTDRDASDGQASSPGSLGVVGFCSGGPALRPSASDVAELYVLNVDPVHWRRGVGERLLDAFTAWAVRRGMPRAVLWVARDNGRARAFYEQRRWSWDGSVEENDTLGARVTECRYQRALYRAAPGTRVALSNGASDLEGILALQRANLAVNLPADEVERDGFVTVQHTRESLERMHEIAPSIVARQDDRVVAYALTMPLACRQYVPVLEPMFRMFETVSYRGTALTSVRFYVMGQICVAKAWRGHGLFDALYVAHRAHYAASYQLLLSEVSQRNGRSLRAHARAGLEEVTRYRDQTDDWVVLVLDLRRGI